MATIVPKFTVHELRGGHIFHTHPQQRRTPTTLGEQAVAAH
ncbi:MAG TPA: hypothetical protein VGU25_00465 [Acidobacteriaceae bacterium]|nr:hypothetical protein [Acidobacteriaceae bacterium]